MNSVVPSSASRWVIVVEIDGCETKQTRRRGQVALAVDGGEVAELPAPPEGRYVTGQWSHGPSWTFYGEAGEDWFGFKGVRALGDEEADILMIPLAGHTLGHCGIRAVRRARRSRMPRGPRCAREAGRRSPSRTRKRSRRAVVNPTASSRRCRNGCEHRRRGYGRAGPSRQAPRQPIALRPPRHPPSRTGRRDGPGDRSRLPKAGTGACPWASPRSDG